MSNREYQDIPRPRKRLIQEKLTQILKDYGFKDNTIIVLSGPNPKEAIKVFNRYSVYNNCILVEKDKNIFCQVSEIPKNSILINEDVFDIVDIFNDTITGIDLDFCITVRKDMIPKIINLINRSNQEKIWLRLTSSFHGQSKRLLYAIQATICSQVSNKYRVINSINESYKDTSAMNTWQVILQSNEPYNYTKSNQEGLSEPMQIQDIGSWFQP